MKKIKVFLTVLVLVTMACVCSSSTPSSAPEKIGEATESAQSNSPAYEVYKIGDIIQTGQITIVMTNAFIQNGVLHTTFTVENKGSDQTTISSLMSFSAKDTDGTKLQIEFSDCETGGLDGTVLPGDKLKGNLCWSGVVTDAAKIYFEPELFSSQIIVWEVSK